MFLLRKDTCLFNAWPLLKMEGPLKKSSFSYAIFAAAETASETAAVATVVNWAAVVLKEDADDLLAKKTVHNEMAE